MTLRRAGCSVICAAILAYSVAPALAYQEGAVSGGGTIKGKVVYNGRNPTRTILPTKDQNVCGQIREEPEVFVGADKGVQEGIVYLTGVTSGKPWPAAAKAPTLDNKACAFSPRVQVIGAGTIAISNSDPVLHNTHGFYGRRTAFNVALPNQGQTVPVELTRPGQARIECDAHGWMLGYVYVVDNPYHVLTDKNGAFEIRDIPPGDYTLVANQEFTGPTEIKVTVKSGETIEVPVELVKR